MTLAKLNSADATSHDGNDGMNLVVTCGTHDTWSYIVNTDIIQKAKQKTIGNALVLGQWWPAMAQNWAATRYLLDAAYYHNRLV